MWLVYLQGSRQGHFPGGRTKTAKALEAAGQGATGLNLMTEKSDFGGERVLLLFIGKISQVKNS